MTAYPAEFEGSRAGGRRGLVALGAAAANVVGTGPIVFYVSPLFLPVLTHQFGWSRSSYSAGLLLTTLVMAALQPVIGRAVDRWGVRRVLLPGIVCAGLSVMAPALLDGSIGLSVLLFFVLGIGAAFQTPTAYSKLVAGWFTSTRGLMLGLCIGGGIGLGAFLMPRIVAWTITHAGWREAYLGLGLLTILIGAPAILLCLRDPPRAGPGAKGAAPAAGVTLGAARSNPVFWRLALAIFLGGVAITGIMVHSIIWLGDRGVPRGTALMLLGAIGLSQIVGRLLSGLLQDRIESPLASAPFFLAPLAGVLLLDFGTPTATLLAVAGTLIGLGLGAEIEIGAYLVSRYFGMRQFAVIYGIMQSAFAISTAVGPLLMGMTFDIAGSYEWAVHGAELALAVATVLVATLGRYNFGVRQTSAPTADSAVSAPIGA